LPRSRRRRAKDRQREVEDRLIARVVLDRKKELERLRRARVRTVKGVE
jgi:hypothetical protein